MTSAAVSTPVKVEFARLLVVNMDALAAQWSLYQMMVLQQNALALQAEHYLQHPTAMHHGVFPPSFPDGMPSMTIPQTQQTEVPAPVPKEPTPDVCPSPSATRCKFGRRCTRENCWFLHPNGRKIDKRKRDDSDSSPVGRELFPAQPVSDRSKLPRQQEENSSDQEVSKDDSAPPQPNQEVHSILRKAVPEWPRVISTSGKLKDKKLEGQGWALHFLHPHFPRSPVSVDDVQAVVSVLRQQGLGALGAAKVTSPGVIQVPLGLHRHWD